MGLLYTTSGFAAPAIATVLGGFPYMGAIYLFLDYQDAVEQTVYFSLRFHKARPFVE
jgi:hypothetical protein